MCSDDTENMQGISNPLVASLLNIAVIIHLHFHSSTVHNEEIHLQRHGLALRRRNSISQKLPEQFKEKLSCFYEMCAKFLKIGKYPLALVRNMDETPVFFDMVPNKSFAKKGSQLVVRTST